MKKFNKNILVFVFFIVFVIVGIWGDCFEQLKWKTIDLAAGIKHGNISSFFDFKYYVDDISNKELSYHDNMMDVNSVKDNLLGTRVVDKTETIVAKANNGTLLGYFQEEKDIEDVISSVDKIETNNNISVKNNAKYIYCSVPAKTYYGDFPQNTICFNKINNDRLLSELSNRNIPYIDLTDCLSPESVKLKQVKMQKDR